ncbi:ABC transporter permease [Flavisolibacter ginsenosidimutans]|uniref:ABC transporter permease n=1 Tax=Flavisolibacter ginsenosidimutans TaxID=661481 RepID=A0A5B8UFL5_9BACT|nr:FtsX-like permease family protein [Flavisolibacter ginsenosidimutans]QEC55165.1 ABC transporter permease [Flavisolibacter ginsenosidimutans]
MNVSSFIAQRIAFNRQKSFSRFIIRLSILATVISVAVMIITLSVVNGFQKTVSEKVFSFWGHVRIASLQPGKASIAEEEPIHQAPELIRSIKQNPQIQSVYPFATKYAILKTTEEMEGVLLKGFDSSYGFKNLQQFLQPGGRWPQFNDSTYSREIVISTYTASQLHLKLSDRVLIYFVRADGTLRPDKLTIVGIYKTGIEEYDKTFAIGDLKLIRRLNNWAEDEIGGYEIFLKDYKQMDAVSRTIYNDPHFPHGQNFQPGAESGATVWETKTARELYPNIFDWLGVQDTNQFILIIIMVVVAAINLITCLIILVLERVRMIGILKALGASNWTVQKIFLYQSGIITFTGVVIGTLFALALLFLQMKTGFVRLKEEAYFMDTATVQILWWQVAIVCAGTIIISVLILFIPSLLVRKIQPIKAIHFR